MGTQRNTALALVVIRSRCSPTLTERVTEICTQYQKLVFRWASHKCLVIGWYVSDQAEFILKWFPDLNLMVITADVVPGWGSPFKL